MSTKICWIDVETTGLNPVNQDVIQVAGIIDINGKVEQEFEFKCSPYSYDDVQPKALEVHGYSIADLKTFEDPRIVKTQVEAILCNYVNKFQREDKFYFAGYNAPFDQGFMSHFWKKSGDKYFNSFFEYKVLDVFPMAIAYAQSFASFLPNHKLETMAKHMGIEIKAHDALSDIRATRAIYTHCMDLMKEGMEVYKLAREEGG